MITEQVRSADTRFTRTLDSKIQPLIKQISELNSQVERLGEEVAFDVNKIDVRYKKCAKEVQHIAGELSGLSVVDQCKTLQGL